MYVKAIDTVSKFVRPIYGAIRTYNSTEVQPGAATLFFINEEGYALTCKHVVEGQIASHNQYNQIYEDFKRRQAVLPTNSNKNRKALDELKKECGYDKGDPIEYRIHFENCFDKYSTIKFWSHPGCDLAIIKFEGFTKLNCHSFPKFKKDTSDIKAGKNLCRLGYAFPIINHFYYDKDSDNIIWKPNGYINPPLALEGMITRLIPIDHINCIEMSTPGYDYMSGGPLFDQEGSIYGMNIGVRNLYTNFNCDNVDIYHLRKKKTVTEYPFAHLGVCIPCNIITDFLDYLHIRYDSI